MTEREWLSRDDPEEMLNFVSLKVRIVRISERKLRLLACAFCRCSRQLLLRKDLLAFLNVAERYADGHATGDELAKAHSASNGIACRLYEETEFEKEIHRGAEATAVANATNAPSEGLPMVVYTTDAAWMIDRAASRNPGPRLCGLIRDVIGNPFCPVYRRCNRRLTSLRKLSQLAYYEHRVLPSGTLDPSRLDALADALESAGHDNAELVGHLRSPGPHVRGCWAVDLVLGKK